MDIKEKLKYIQEGHSFSEIVSDNFTPLNQVLKESHELFMESFMADAKYIIEMGEDLKSKATFFDHVKNVLKWLRDKVVQFINFIRQKLFSSGKGTKQTVKNVKDTAAKMEIIGRKPSKRINPEDEPDTYSDNSEDHGILHKDGTLHYNPENHEITIFSKVLDTDNFFDSGYKRIYNTLHEYISKLEQNPSNHDQIISVDDVINTKPFLNKVFKESLSVNYDKLEIFKKIYGDLITKPITVRELTLLADKLYSMDEESTVFANWIQKSLPRALDDVERHFTRNMQLIKDKLEVGSSKNVQADTEMVNNLNDALAKVIKLMNMQMSVIQIFAQMHVEVFVHLKGEIEHYDWVLNPSNQDYDQDDFNSYDNHDGLIH
jgi:hypothetical protein